MVPNLTSNILVVNDDPHSWQFLQHMLMQAGYRVETLQDYSELVNLFKKGEQGLVIFSLKQKKWTCKYW